jgi:hypothetical protein
MLSDALVRVALPEGQQLVYVYSASVPSPYMTAHLRTPLQLERAVSTQTTINPDGSYVVLETIDVDGLSLKPANNGLLLAMKQKSELLHFGYVTQWEIFRRATYTSQVLSYDDPSIPRQFLMNPRFSSVDFDHVRLLILDYINKMCEQTPTDLRVGAPIPTTNFVGLCVTLTETQRKPAVNSQFQSGRYPNELED